MDRSDVLDLIVLLAEVQNDVLSGTASETLVRKLWRRLVRDVDRQPDRKDLEARLDEVNQRLRRALERAT